tara:strand:- start:918 stop:1679 length:762 start_codon:yes stop_codon:yes gene_type:complete
LKTDISILIASNKSESLKAFLDSADSTCADPDKVEFVIGIDRDDEEMLNFCSTLSSNYKFLFTVIPLDNPDGYFGLAYVYDTCFIASSESSYFVQVLNDKLKLICQDWDKKYLSYAKAFSDDIFVVRTSKNRHRKHPSSSIDCLNRPDNYRIYTRKMYSLLEGHGDYWSADTWHEPMLSILGELGEDRQIICDVDIFEVNSETVSVKTSEQANKIGCAINRLLSSKYYDLTFKRIAEKILLHINNSKHGDVGL